MSIKSFLLASLQQPAPWLSRKPLCHQLFRQRKRKGVYYEDCLFPPRSRICSSPLLALKLSEEFVPLHQERAFWSIHPPQDCEGTWETEVKGTWAKVGLKKPEKEEEKFMQRYRLNLPTFQSLVNIIGPLVAKVNALMRSSICPEKRIAIFLHWMAHGEEYHELANSYRVGTSTVHSIIHEIIPIVCSLASKEIVFPTEVSSLVETVRGFELLSGLPRCCGAIDGTFMQINKPMIKFGDAYYCYKQYPALLIFACVTSRGLITYVKTGIPGAVGDASSYNTSKLKENIDSGYWLAGMRTKVENTKIPLFLVGDAGFSFSTRLMKCYAVPAAQQTTEQKAFNYALIRTRRVVENAFGRLKARWRTLVSNFIRDADFAVQVSLAACVLHNICERSACPFDTKWLVDIEAVRRAGNTVKTGIPRAVGDASSYNTIKLKENIDSGHWLAGMRVKVENTNIPLFLVGDAAFFFSTRLMKCYAVPAAQQTTEQKAFNYALIRTRRVVENAFGRLKARWRTLVSNFIRDADFAVQVSLAACVLHNICERSACPFDTQWLVDIEAVRRAGNTTQLHAPNPQEQHPAAEQIRSILARHVKNTRRLPV